MIRHKTLDKPMCVNALIQNNVIKGRISNKTARVPWHRTAVETAPQPPGNARSTVCFVSFANTEISADSAADSAAESAETAVCVTTTN